VVTKSRSVTCPVDFRTRRVRLEPNYTQSQTRLTFPSLLCLSKSCNLSFIINQHVCHIYAHRLSCLCTHPTTAQSLSSCPYRCPTSTSWKCRKRYQHTWNGYESPFGKKDGEEQVSHKHAAEWQVILTRAAFPATPSLSHQQTT
jgi:hypothetical protein